MQAGGDTVVDVDVDADEAGATDETGGGVPGDDEDDEDDGPWYAGKGVVDWVLWLYSILPKVVMGIITPPTVSRTSGVIPRAGTFLDFVRRSRHHTY